MSKQKDREGHRDFMQERRDRERYLAEKASSPYMVKLRAVHESLQNLHLATVGIQNKAEFVPAPVGMRGKFDGYDVKQAEGSAEGILSILRDPQKIVILLGFGDGKRGIPDKRTELTITFGEAINSTIQATEAWLNDAKSTKGYLVDYWVARYGQGSPKIEANSKWYDGKEKAVSEVLAKLKELKQLSEDQSPLSTPEKSGELLGRMLGLGIDTGYMTGQISAISSAVSRAYDRKGVKKTLKELEDELNALKQLRRRNSQKEQLVSEAIDLMRNNK